MYDQEYLFFHVATCMHCVRYSQNDASIQCLYLQTLLHQTTLIYLSIMYACFFDFASDLNHVITYIHGQWIFSSPE